MHIENAIQCHDIHTGRVLTNPNWCDSKCNWGCDRQKADADTGVDFSMSLNLKLELMT